LIYGIDWIIGDTDTNSQPAIRLFFLEGNWLFFYQTTNFFGDYDSRLPEQGGPGGQEELRSSGYLTDYAVYLCPSTTTSAQTGTAALNATTTDYAFCPGMMLGDSAKFGRSDSGVACDKNGSAGNAHISNGNAPNHTDYGNVLFLGGNVNGFSTANWYSAINIGYTMSMEPNKSDSVK